MDIDSFVVKNDIDSSPSVSEEENLTANDEKDLRTSKNSFLLFDEEKSDEESITSSLDDFLDDSNHASDSDSSSTVSSMDRLSLNSNKR